MVRRQDVSYVDTTGEKPMLVVEGEPFFYMGTQLSPHRLRYFGWSFDDMEKLFAAAADNRFTVLAVPVLWNWIEPEEGRMEWEAVRKFIDFSVRHRIYMELLWFGSDVCSVSDPSEGCPPWVLDRYERVRAADGELYTCRDFNYVTYRYETFRKLDKADGLLLASEQAAIAALLAYVREYTDRLGRGTAVIGVQLLNEPTACRMRDNVHASVPDLVRSYSESANRLWAQGKWSDAAAFNVALFWHYLNGLGQAVKCSGYSVWTRVNCNKNYEGGDFVGKLVSYNERMRCTSGTHVDFIGDDPYTDNIDWLYEYGRTSVFGSGLNMPMIMENSGRYENSDQLVFNALAGNACYNIWELVSSGDLEGETGFYDKNHAQKTIRPKWYQPRIRRFNELLLKNRRYLASLRAGGARLAFYNRAFGAVSDSGAWVEGVEIRYRTLCGGGGIALFTGRAWCLMSTADAQFLVPAALTAGGSAQIGEHDDRLCWIAGGTPPVTQEMEWSVIAIRAYECIRIEAT